VQLGFVASFNRPGGNATGVSLDTTEMVPKRMEVLQELVPKDTKVAMLVSPGTITRSAGSAVPDAETAFAEKNGMFVLSVRNREEFDKELNDGFDAIVKKGARALLVSADPFYFDRRSLIVRLAARHALPAVYPLRAYVMAGGLASYGPSIADAYRQIGVYAGRILRGSRPENLPVVFPVKWEFVLNLRTAKELSLTVSPWLMARVHEAIE
jgi:putative ABC transport system substrate-binding protein